MQVEVTCRCGWRCRGTEDEVIRQVQEHGRAAHAVETSADEVRAIWRVVHADPSAG
jgi:predicted small metal-binding protein